MLTIHDKTFEFQHTGWGSHWPIAEKVLYGFVVKFCAMDPTMVAVMHRNKRIRDRAMADLRRAAVSQIDRVPPKYSKTGKPQARLPAPEKGAFKIIPRDT